MESKSIQDTLEVLEHVGYKIIKKLGKGSFGVVYLAKDAAHNRKVAIKIAHQKFPGEWTYWITLHHPNILELYDKFEAGSNFVYIMEHAQHGTIRDWVNRPWYKKLCLRDQFSKWFWQLIATMEFLHGKGFYHLDVKMDNVFLNRNFDMKLGDLGLLCRSGQNVLLIGAPKFWPPEVQRMEMRKQHLKAGPWLEKVDAFFLVAKLPDSKSLIYFPSDIHEAEERISFMYHSINRNLQKVKNTRIKPLLVKLLHQDVEKRLTCRVLLEMGEEEMYGGKCSCLPGCRPFDISKLKTASSEESIKTASYSSNDSLLYTIEANYMISEHSSLVPHPISSLIIQDSVSKLTDLHLSESCHVGHELPKDQSAKVVVSLSDLSKRPVSPLHLMSPSIILPKSFEEYTSPRPEEQEN